MRLSGCAVVTLLVLSASLLPPALVWESDGFTAVILLVVPPLLAALVSARWARGFVSFLRLRGAIVLIGAFAGGVAFEPEVEGEAIQFGLAFLIVGGWLLTWFAVVGPIWFGGRWLVRDWGRR